MNEQESIKRVRHELQSPIWLDHDVVHFASSDTSLSVGDLRTALQTAEQDLSAMRQAVMTISDHNVVWARALSLAATRLEILTGRMRACHEDTGKHELLDEAEMFCAEARSALVSAAREEQHDL